jgi:hypothetical protein
MEDASLRRMSMGGRSWFTRRRYQQFYFRVCRHRASISTWGRCRYLHGHDAAVNLDSRAHLVGCGNKVVLGRLLRISANR